MEPLLQQVIGFAFMSILDGFSGYNQISMIKEDKHKTTFTDPWGTLLVAFWLDLGLLVLHSNKPLDHWPFWQQAAK